MSLRIGVDIGGTFTDLVAIAADGAITTRKVASTPHDYGEGIIAGLHDDSPQNVPSYATFILYDPAVHLYKFVFGMALAIWWNRIGKAFEPNTSHELTTIAATGVLVPGSYFLLHTLCPLNQYFCADQVSEAISVVLFGPMIFVFAYQRGIVSRVLSLPFFVYLGEISFGIYMLHGIVLPFLLRDLGLSIDSRYFSVCVAVLIGVCAMTYHWLEKPARLAITRSAGRWLGSGPEITHPVPIELVDQMKTRSSEG